MCFSPEASFAAAAAIGAAGAAALAQKPERRALPLACIPLIFALHQAIEGGVWLGIEADGAAPVFGSTLFLIVAFVVWPLYAPAAALAAETEDSRRRAMAACLAVGVLIATYLGIMMVVSPYETTIRGGCLSYQNGVDYPLAAELLYGVATTLPFLLASRPWILGFGAAVLGGLALTREAYAQAAISVWCFFAALASVVLLVHFVRERRLRRTLAGPKPAP